MAEISDDINSDARYTAEVIPPDEDWLGPFGKSSEFTEAEIVEEEPDDSKSRIKSERPPPRDRKASGGIPDIDDWMHFFGRVVIRVATDWYIDWAFRGIDENLLTDRDIDRIKLADDERDRIARPFAELAHKTKFTRKHGRTIIAASESIDAMLQMGMWFSRVSRVAARYRNMQQPSAPARRPVRPEPRTPEPEERIMHERSGSSEANGHDPKWRPQVNGYVINPFG